MCFRPPVAAKQEKKCPKCETMNPPEAEVCSNCGEALPKLSVPPPGVSMKQPTAPPGVPPRPAAPPKAPPPPAPKEPPKKEGE